MSVLEIDLLGSLEVRVDARLVVLPAPKQRALLALLALELDQPVTAERLIELLWDGEPPSTARKNLQVLVGRIRTAIAPATALQTTEHGYRLARDGVAVDVDRVLAEQRVARRLLADGCRHEAADQLAAALERWRAAPLGDLAAEPWARPWIGELDRLHVALSVHRIELLLELDHRSTADSESRDAVYRHPTEARLHELRALALYRCNRQVEALEACHAGFAAVTASPADAVDELRALERRILQHDPTLSAAPGSQLPPLPAPPASPLELIGRERPLRELVGIVRSEARSITITGPGGTGKTRLALELAHVLRERFEQVVWLDLSPLASVDSVATALVSALGITGADSDPVSAVAHAIGTRPLLILLDNFEHVLDAAPIVATLHERCPRAVFVATSREALGIEPELVHELPPLEVLLPGASGRSDAAQLFVARAELVDGLVDATSETSDAIDAICRAVDGLPLGIELAAARTMLLTPAQVLERIERRFDVLRSSDRSVNPRQRSLTDLVAWSYDLLNEQEQRVLRVLSTFVGGAALDDLGLVLTEIPGDLLARHVDSLVARSLVVDGVDVLGRRRVRLLDTIARFARLRLEHDPDELVLRCRHAEVMHGIAARSNTHHPDAQPDRDRQVVELQNVRAAIEWGMFEAPNLAASTFGSLFRYYLTKGVLQEVRDIGVQLLDRDSRLHPLARADVELLVGSVGWQTGHIESSLPLLASATTTYMQQGLIEQELNARAEWIDALRMHQDNDGAVRETRIAIDRLARCEDVWTQGRLRFVGAHVLQSDDDDRRRAELAVSRDCFAQAQDDYWRLNAETCLAIEVGLRSRDASTHETLESIATWMSRGGYVEYAGYVRSCQLRVFVEWPDSEQCIPHIDAWLREIQAGGSQMVLMYACSLASVVMHRSGDLDLGLEYAARAIEVGIDMDSTIMLEYALAVIAHIANDHGDIELADLALTLIDVTLLDQSYRLDAWVASTVTGIGSRAHTPACTDDKATSLRNVALRIAQLVLSREYAV